MKSIRIVLGSLRTALSYPRVFVTAWFLVTVAAAVALWPMFRASDAQLGRHPGAGFLLDESLDVDFLRENPTLGVSLLGGALFMLVAGVFLAGGILSCVGRRPEDRPVRFTCAGFLAEGARLFPRNLRVVIVGVVVAALVFWGADALGSWLRRDLLYQKDPGAVAVPLVDIRWMHLLEALDWVWGFVFLGLLFTSKVAMSHLAVHDKRSALLAWLFATGKVLRHPLRSSLCVALFTVLWLGGAHLLGMATAHFLEVRQELWLGLAVGQLGIMLGQVVWVGFVVGARRFVEQSLPTAAAEVSPVPELARKPKRPVKAETAASA